MKKVAFAVFSLFILLGSSIESQAQQVKVDNVYYSIGKDPKYGNVAVIDSCRVKGLLGLDLVLPSEVEIGGRIYPIKDVRNLQKVSANSVTIPGSVEVIKAKAFADATTRKIVIPKSVKRIEDRAFYNLKYLPDIVIPNSVRYLGDEVFANCRALLEVVLPKNVDHIGKGLFRDNNFLKKVRFPENMTELPEMTFYGCKKLLNLEHLVMPALTKIGKKAFAGSSLMTCPLPQTVKTVDEEAFKGCGNLLTVFLPGVSRIEREAFADCPKLKVYFKGNTPQYVADDAFRGTEYEAKKNGSGSGGSATAQNRPSTSQTKNTSASSPKPKTGTSGSSQQNRIYTDEQMAQVSTFRGPFFNYAGKPVEECYAGVKDGNWVFPPHTTTESAQNKWNDERIARQDGDESFTNARLAREIIAGKKWIEGQDKINGPVREFMYSIPSRLDQELANRAKAITEYVNAYNDFMDSEGEDIRWVETKMGRIASCIKSDKYLRAISSPMDALEPYLEDYVLEFFNKRGGLSNAHKAQRMDFPGLSGGAAAVASSKGSSASSGNSAAASDDNSGQKLTAKQMEILASFGMNGISLNPVGTAEKDGTTSASPGEIPTKASSQVAWRDKLPAAWKCNNLTLVNICNKVTAYNLRRKKDSATYQWNEVLAVVDADYNDMELSGRIEALKDAADAYLECQQVFSDPSSSEQEMLSAARQLSTALKSKYYKRALNSPLAPILTKIQNQKQVAVLKTI